MIAVVDSGPLYAVADSDDADHERCRAVLERRDLQLAIPALVVAEVTYMIGRRLGSRAEAAFLCGLEGFDVEAPAADDWTVIGELVRRYESFPLGGTDASVIALAARLGTELVVTVDHRHFGAVRPPHVPALQLLP